MLYVIFFMTQVYIKSLFCLCKRDGIEGKAFEKKKKNLKKSFGIKMFET